MTGTEIGALVYGLCLFHLLVGALILALIYQSKENQQKKEFFKTLTTEQKALIAEYQTALKVNLFSKKKYEEK